MTTRPAAICARLVQWRPFPGESWIDLESQMSLRAVCLRIMFRICGTAPHESSAQHIVHAVETTHDSVRRRSVRRRKSKWQSLTAANQSKTMWMTTQAERSIPTYCSWGCPPRDGSRKSTMMTTKTLPNSSWSDPDRVHLGPAPGSPTGEASCYARPL